MKAREIKEEIKKRFLCIVSKEQCYRAKKKALEILTGKLSEHYARIWEYGGEIIRSNPGSTTKVGVDIKEDGSSVFKRFYVCFKAIKDGWIRGCSRVIGLDGCFLKGQFKGKLLTTIGRDGNNQVYPIAWVVIDVENKDNQDWFIKLLVEYLGLEIGEGLAIISDQHKVGLLFFVCILFYVWLLFFVSLYFFCMNVGISRGFEDKLPLVENRQCAKHVYVNFKKVYNGIDYNRHFWAASMSTIESSFHETMEEFKELNVSAYEHLMAMNLESWSRAFYREGRTCEVVENGILESFNSVILEARTKPLLTMLEDIRMYVMERFYRMSILHLTWRGDVCPTILTKLDEWCKDMRLWSVVASDTNVFEVRLGFEFFQAMTPYAKPLPPPARRMPGRPKTRRRKHVTKKDGEYRKINSVGGTKISQNCWEEGHNKRTYKNPTKPQPPKEKKRKGMPLTRDVAMKRTTTSTSQKSQNSQHTQKMDGQARSNNQKKCKERHLNMLKGYMKVVARTLKMKG
uniref:MULE transposase domain-containing protein n=1 Tax=Lactuca sativa TaxID=4236 RepID=A0A9R1VEI7_LACSA|nr:hypothetical protein LSAT_V11C500278220 [Lactuca sativa]